MPAGEYAVYALYPADRWSKDVNGLYKAEFPMGYVIPFGDASSAHLREHMFMKADAGIVTVSGADDGAIDLDFYHLTSVIRFHLTAKNSDAESVALDVSLTLKEVTTPSPRPFFNTSAYLGGFDATDLAMQEDARVTEMVLYPTVADGIPFTKNGDTWGSISGCSCFPPLAARRASIWRSTHIFWWVGIVVIGWISEPAATPFR